MFKQSSDLFIFFRVEKQTIVEVTPIHKNLGRSEERNEAKTKEILEKIAEINKKFGLTSKKQKPNYYQFPFINLKSNSENPQNKQRSDFKFSSNPFSNPIFEYLERENHKISNDDNIDGTKQYIESNPQEGYKISMTNSNAEATEEDNIPGQYIKRKIVHQQTLLVPNPNYVSSQMAAAMPNMSPNIPVPYMLQVPYMSIPSEPQFNADSNKSDNKNLNHLEKKTVENIRNIVSNSQLLQVPGHHLPYLPNYLRTPVPTANIPMPVHYGFMEPSRETLGQIPQNYQMNGPYGPPKGRQNWNWPGSNYFPIHIRDPFMQMYNAFTSMVEYGPGAGSTNSCPGRPNRNKIKNDMQLREAKTTDSTVKVTEQITNFDTSDVSTASSSAENDKDYLSVESVDVSGSKEGDLSFVTFNKDRVGKDAEKERRDWEKLKISGKAAAFVINGSRPNSKIALTENSFPSVSFSKIPTFKSQSVVSPPKRDPTGQSPEFGEEESDKSDEVISNDGNKKFFSRDNTGSGVFINRLKVRKGGVAIAGPGGIATAGSGGTAIVGPNGVAYTHPDSLAIAGSGTKVVAVDPAISLREIVGNSTNADKTSHAFPPSRVGKVVAVGPVVYYNKG